MQQYLKQIMTSNKLILNEFIKPTNILLILQTERLIYVTKGGKLNTLQLIMMTIELSKLFWKRGMSTKNKR